MYVTTSNDHIVGLLITDLATTSYITEHVKIKKANKAIYCKNNESRDTCLSKKLNIF